MFREVSEMAHQRARKFGWKSFCVLWIWCVFAHRDIDSENWQMGDVCQSCPVRANVAKRSRRWWNITGTTRARQNMVSGLRDALKQATRTTATKHWLMILQRSGVSRWRWQAGRCVFLWLMNRTKHTLTTRPVDCPPICIFGARQLQWQTLGSKGWTQYQNCKPQALKTLKRQRNKKHTVACYWRPISRKGSWVQSVMHYVLQ